MVAIYKRIGARQAWAGPDALHRFILVEMEFEVQKRATVAICRVLCRNKLPIPTGDTRIEKLPVSNDGLLVTTRPTSRGSEQHRDEHHQPAKSNRPANHGDLCWKQSEQLQTVGAEG